MVDIKKSKLILGIFIPILAFFLMSQNTFAEAFSRTYSSASVNFYTSSQINATVNLPWNVNPGTSTFYLNSTYFDENSWLGYKISYISGRMVMEIAPYTTTNFYVCGINTAYSISNGTITQCVGSLTIRYSDGTSTVLSDKTVYINQTSSPYRITIYFDYQGETSSDKTISLMQYEFKAKTGYDVVSRNTSWNNTTLFQLVEGRGTVNVYETPPSGAEIANDLLQQQIGQNQTIINQNQAVIDQNNEAYDNISNQSANDISGATNNQTTSLINVITGFIGAFSGINATNCNLTLEFPNYAGGSRVVNICSGKEKAPRIVEIGSSLLLICVFVPLAYVLIRMIYNEIRSWTNG